jgi:hypothetical protein
MKPDAWPMTPMRLELEQLRQAHRRKERRRDRLQRLFRPLAQLAARIKRPGGRP